jgi:hypothetical protein
MSYKLGLEAIAPVNDGSVGIKYRKDRKVIIWGDGKIPVLSVEVSNVLPTLALMEGKTTRILKEE